ncbi:unnamed protein product [Colias eurytheme]|nr:unnamed protein product [Colias eurytheme]
MSNPGSRLAGPIDPPPLHAKWLGVATPQPSPVWTHHSAPTPQCRSKCKVEFTNSPQVQQVCCVPICAASGVRMRVALYSVWDRGRAVAGTEAEASWNINTMGLFFCVLLLA